MNAQLTEAEEQLQELLPEKSHQWIAIIVLPLLLLWVGYALFLEEDMSRLSSLTNQKEQMEAKIAHANTKGLARKIETMRHTIKKSHAETLELQKDLVSLNTYIETIPQLRYDEDTYLKMLEKVLDRSVALSLKIDQAEEALLDENNRTQSPRMAPGAFGVYRFKRLVITGEGNFVDIVQLANYIDTFTLPHRIAQLRIEKVEEQEVPSFLLSVDFYGVSQ